MNIKSKFSLLLVVVSIFVLSLSACSNGSDIQPTSVPDVAPPTSLSISGAGGAARVLSYLADEYSAKYNDLDFRFLAGSGSGGGVNGVVDGTLDLGTMSRLPKESEMEKGIAHLAFAYDPVVIAVSQDVTIEGLKSEQLKDIFAGTITNWTAVGGPDSLITVLTREEDDSNTKIIRKGIIGDTEFARGAQFITSEDELKTAITKFSSSIGYMAYSGVQLDSLGINVLAIDGQHPSEADPAYPLDNRLLGVAYLPGAVAKVQGFLDFITSDEATRILSAKGIPSISQVGGGPTDSGR